MRPTPMQRRYQRFPRLMFLLRRIQRVNYEPEMELLDILCDRSATSVDVGAKLGMYTHRLLPRSRDVVAFEPIPVLVHLMGRVFRKRPVRIIPCALSDSSGRTTMRVPFGENGEVKLGRSTIEPSNSLTHDGVARVDEIEVELKTLDQCDLHGVGFIKVDVEGHELAVLRGGARTIERDRPNLLIEANDHHHPGAVEALRQLLGGWGYLGRFVRGQELVDLDSIDDPAFFERESIENFIFVHGSRPEVLARLHDRVTA